MSKSAILTIDRTMKSNFGEITQYFRAELVQNLNSEAFRKYQIVIQRLQIGYNDFTLSTMCNKKSHNSFSNQELKYFEIDFTF